MRRLEISPFKRSAIHPAAYLSTHRGRDKRHPVRASCGTLKRIDTISIACALARFF